MNRFCIDKLVISGGRHEPSVIDFCRGLNFIIGPSNTGKSLIMDCIDYVFGFQPRKDTPSKLENNSYGYTMITLHLLTAGGTVVITREIGKNKYYVSGTDDAVEHGTYLARGTKSINDLLLHLIGVTEEHRILKNEKGDTQALTWRSILYLFFIKQEDVARTQSALKNPVGVGQTASLAALLFLMTGQDANGIEVKESAEILKAKKEAQIDFIQRQRQYFIERREALEAKLPSEQEISSQKAIEDISAEIDALQQDIDAAVSESQKLMAEIYDENTKLSECNTVERNFKILGEQYRSDIQRLGFIVDGKIATGTQARIRHCPICGTESEQKPDPEYILAASEELRKIGNQLSDLQLAQNDILQEKKAIQGKIQALEKRRSEVDALLTKNLRPKMAEFKNQLEEHMRRVRLVGQIEEAQETESYLKDELVKQETEEIPKNPTYKVNSYYPLDLIQKYEAKLIEILQASNIGGADTARLNMETFEIEIAGKSKSVCAGGGLCGILNTITAYAMSSFLLENDGIAPAFFAADSPLTQLSEGEHIKEGDTIKEGFVRYLMDHSLEKQVIIVEQKKRLPFVPEENLERQIRVIEFTHNTEAGRYGFLNDVVNPEDE